MTTRLCCFFATVLFAMCSFAQTNKPVDFLKVPGPIVFNSQSYNLSWTSHPAENFYKQEYLVKGDVADKFKSMILIDVITNEADLKGVVNAKIMELKEMKLSNPMVNYNLYDNSKSGEYMLDFLLSSNSADGKTLLAVERNVYRYKIVTGKNGQKSVMLFGISVRSYGNAIDQFLAALKLNKMELVNAVAKFIIPQVSIP